MEYVRYKNLKISAYSDFLFDVARPVKWLFSSLLWDSRSASRWSRDLLSKNKDSHYGEKAVIVCNGPSLLRTDLSAIGNVYSFGLNKINLLFDKNEYRPNCIVAVNPFVIEQNIEFYKKTAIPLYLDYRCASVLGHKKDLAYIHTIGKQSFARDLGGSVFIGGTVTYVALQLAYHLGFRKVALVGCDHSFSSKGPANLTVSADKSDANHFDPRYFSGNMKWQLPDLIQSEISYILAKEVFESDGGCIYNATVGGELNIFPRCTLEEFCSD